MEKKNIDWSSIGFGYMPTDYRYVSNFKDGKCVGIHLEPGPDGGLVMLDDTTVLDRALNILREEAE